jgi:hypothetical protein
LGSVSAVRRKNEWPDYEADYEAAEQRG